MKTTRPGLLATRATNQYRRRDIVGYLGVRHLLKNTAAQSDWWASVVATELVLNRPAPAYFLSHHFKSENADGTFVSREISIPSPLEILAETALLSECAEHDLFRNPGCVFTYQLARPWDRSGSFVNYSDGLRRRQRAIAAACDANQTGIVRYLDIKKFYPSIQSSDAKKAWDKLAEPLRAESRALGSRLLEDHLAEAGSSSRGLLTGPMFSHLMANLVMRDIDVWAQDNLSVAYFRYVDDITLVGSEINVAKAEKDIVRRLAELELELHDENSGKALSITCQEWQKGRNDYEDEANDLSWRRLIGDLKTFLLVNPLQGDDLQRAFLDVGMRIPVPDYSVAAFEHTYAETFLSLAKRAWFRLKAQRISVLSLVQTAELLKRRFRDELVPLLEGIDSSTGYSKKRLIPKARFRAGRLIYLDETESLRELALKTRKAADLQLHAEVMQAAVSGDVSRVLRMGANAVQSAAQPLRASGKSVQFNIQRITDVELQGLAILNFNGLNASGIVGDREFSQSGALLSVSEAAVDLKLMNSIDPFVRELACLAGLGADDHPAILDSAFDEADEFILDAVDRLEESIPHGG